jgi:hypothetical protein
MRKMSQQWKEFLDAAHPILAEYSWRVPDIPNDVLFNHLVDLANAEVKHESGVSIRAYLENPFHPYLTLKTILQGFQKNADRITPDDPWVVDWKRRNQ